MQGYRVAWKSDGDFRAGVRAALEDDFAAERGHALRDALEPEVPLGDARTVRGVESAAVVPHREEQAVGLETAGDADIRRPAVADGVHDEFADDAQDRVGRVVGEGGAAHVEADVQRDVLDVRLQRLADRLVHAVAVDGVAAKVPEAVAQLVPAGLQRLRGERVASRVDLQGDAGEVLGERVVQLDGEARALGDAQRLARALDVRLVELAAAPVGEAVEDAVPDEDAEQEEPHRRDEVEKPLGRPPGRGAEDAQVLGRPHQDRDARDPREDVIGPPGVGLEEAASRHLDLAAGKEPVRRRRAGAEVDGDALAVRIEEKPTLRAGVVRQGAERAGQPDEMPEEPGVDLVFLSAAAGDFAEGDVPGPFVVRGLSGHGLPVGPDEVDLVKVGFGVAGDEDALSDRRQGTSAGKRDG